MKKILLLSCIVLGFAWAFRPNPEARSATAFHTAAELEWFSTRGLTNDSTFLFVGSGRCVQCHATDTAGIASITQAGVDVNVVDDWRATMMANSSKDPFWRAKVSHEMLVNPGLADEIETTCTSCHAPMGHFSALYEGATHYSLAQAVSDSLGGDGVSCLACHKQAPDGIGTQFSGALEFDTNKVAYGPYTSPLSSPMLNEIQYEPVYGAFTAESEVCAGCHTLITKTVDLSGNLTGNSFVEQATYHEWVNSDYNGTQTCQGCHMPRINEPIVISSGLPSLPPRFFYGLHHLVGGNNFMLNMMKEMRDSLGIDATAANFDSTMARTTRLLQQQTLNLSATLENRTTDTAYYAVELENRAGHKFPSGYPARRAWIQFILTTEAGDTIFANGLNTYNYWIEGHDLEYERHYDVIESEDQVQIYELVMADVAGNPTTVLERADTKLKDNRLAPAGFTTTHYNYDTTAFAGQVLSDANFNNANGTEGSGTDRVEFHIPLNQYTGQLTATVRVQYQPVPPRWNTSMFSYNSEHITPFRVKFLQSDASPTLIADTVVMSAAVGVDESAYRNFKVYPTASAGQPVTVEPASGLEAYEWRLYSAGGQLVDQGRAAGGNQQVSLPESPGLYLLVLEAHDYRQAFRLVRE